VGEPAAVICQEAERRRCAWIVMGTRGSRVIGAAAQGSVAAAVMAKASVPVVAVRPDGRSFAPPLALVAPAEPRAKAARALITVLESALQAHACAHVSGPGWRTCQGHGGCAMEQGAPRTVVVGLAAGDVHPPWLPDLFAAEGGPAVLVADPGPPASVLTHLLGVNAQGGVAGTSSRR
jgi:hypothetical protein